MPNSAHDKPATAACQRTIVYDADQIIDGVVIALCKRCGACRPCEMQTTQMSMMVLVPPSVLAVGKDLSHSKLNWNQNKAIQIIAKPTILIQTSPNIGSNSPTRRSHVPPTILGKEPCMPVRKPRCCEIAVLDVRNSPHCAATSF